MKSGGTRARAHTPPTHMHTSPRLPTQQARRQAQRLPPGRLPHVDGPGGRRIAGAGQRRGRRRRRRGGGGGSYPRSARGPVYSHTHPTRAPIKHPSNTRTLAHPSNTRTRTRTHRLRTHAGKLPPTPTTNTNTFMGRACFTPPSPPSSTARTRGPLPAGGTQPGCGARDPSLLPCRRQAGIRADRWPPPPSPRERRERGERGGEGERGRWRERERETEREEESCPAVLRFRPAAPRGGAGQRA